MDITLSDVIYAALTFPFCQRKKVHTSRKTDSDFQSFLKWFHTISVEDDEFIGVSACEPSSSSILKREIRSLSGKVTSLADDHGLIDDHIYFHISDVKGFGSNNLPFVGDVVNVEAEKLRTGGGWKAYSVSAVKEEMDWEKEDPEFRVPTVHEQRGSMIGVITFISSDRKSGNIEKDVTFSIEDVTENFKPIVGDWVQAIVSEGSVATDIKPIRTKKLTGCVTSSPWKSRGYYSGSINDDIYFDDGVYVGNYRPYKGDIVAVTAIESKQGKYSWRATEITFIGRNQSSKRSSNTSTLKSGKWTLKGERPEVYGKNPVLPSFLPNYMIPESMRTCVQASGNLLNVNPTLQESLSPENYAGRFSALLHLEELAIEEEILSFKLQNISLTCRGEYLVLHVSGISDGKPSLLVGDTVILQESTSGKSFDVLDDLDYLGFIHHIAMETEELYIKFHRKLHASFEESDRFDASFTYSRTPFRRCHFAVNNAKKYYAKKLLFPSSTDISKTKVQSEVKLFAKGKATNNCDAPSTGCFFNDCLNERQKSAVQRILQGEARPKPYILFGPPGTGKTVTLVEAILQIIVRVPSSRLLVCAPSNSAVDLLCERLHDSGLLTPKTMVRFNAFRRPIQAVAERIRQYCHVDVPLTTVARYQVVLATCVNSGQFYTLRLKPDHFTHVYIDEAGQSTEPECLIPIGLGATGQIVLTGDPEQLGAVLKSNYASHYGLGISLLERLMNSVEYTRNPSSFAEGYNPLLVTKLVNNYRSHPSLLELPSLLFYDNELKACADESFSTSLCGWKYLPTKGFPLIFHGIVGTQARDENCPSWFNPGEIVQITRYVKLLINDPQNPCSASEIGVITPYKKQVEKIRMMFRGLSIEGLKVGSVEEFQGQERKVIILSTVRSAPLHNCGENENLLTLLGFVSNPKRFNVATTRAKALMIVIGNPYVLMKDKYWRALLEHCITNHGYVGSSVSPIIKQLK